MRIHNRTNLDTRTLKRFVRKIAEFEELTKEDIRQLYVGVRYRRRSHCRQDDHPGGYGTYGR